MSTKRTIPGAVPFQLKLTGGDADEHHFQGYDGYLALANFSWTLALITHYIEHGEIRHKGDFDGRRSVHAFPMREGSIEADFAVIIGAVKDPILVGLLGGASAITAKVLYDFTRTVINTTIGNRVTPETSAIEKLNESRAGDIASLSAAIEPSVRVSHGIVGNGVGQMLIVGGVSALAKYDRKSKAYVKDDFIDDEIEVKDVSVSSFNANSGNGSIFDFDLGHVVPIKISKLLMPAYRSIFSWGLDQYSRRTNRRVRITFTKVTAMDGRAKKYLIQHAERV